MSEKLANRRVPLWAVAVALAAGIGIGALLRVVCAVCAEYWRVPAVFALLALYVWGEWSKSKSGRKNQKRLVST